MVAEVDYMGGGGSLIYSGTMTPNTSSFSDIPCIDETTGKSFTPKLVVFYMQLSTTDTRVCKWEIADNDFRSTYGSNFERDLYSTWIGSDKYLYLDGTTIKYKAPSSFNVLTRFIAVG